MQDNKQSGGPVAGGLKTDIVSNIPLAAPGQNQKPADDDDELDKIMRDVGKDIKDIGKQKPKHHWFSHDKQPKTDAKFSARPIDQVTPIPPAPPTPKAAPSAKPATVPKAVAKSAAKPPKPAKTHSAPVGVILLAIVMTGVLSAAAYYAYK